MTNHIFHVQIWLIRKSSIRTNKRWFNLAGNIQEYLYLTVEKSWKNTISFLLQKATCSNEWMKRKEFVLKFFSRVENLPILTIRAHYFSISSGIYRLSNIISFLAIPFLSSFVSWKTSLKDSRVKGRKKLNACTPRIVMV